MKKSKSTQQKHKRVASREFSNVAVILPFPYMGYIFSYVHGRAGGALPAGWVVVDMRSMVKEEQDPIVFDLLFPQRIMLAKNESIFRPIAGDRSYSLLGRGEEGRGEP